jgi:hypothetical protein
MGIDLIHPAKFLEEREVPKSPCRFHRARDLLVGDRSVSVLKVLQLENTLPLRRTIGNGILILKY